jgi:hypothetical protein
VRISAISRRAAAVSAKPGMAVSALCSAVSALVKSPAEAKRRASAM